MSKIQIKLDSLSKIDRFSKLVLKYDNDVNLYKGHNVFDAKSVLSLYTAMAIDFSENIYVELISNNEDEQMEFIKTMDEFIEKEKI